MFYLLHKFNEKKKEKVASSAENVCLYTFLLKRFHLIAISF